MNYNGKVFEAVHNSDGGDVNAQTRFFYHQKDHYLWGHYEGGAVSKGVILGKVELDGTIDFEYQHFDKQGHLKRGRCHSRPELIDGLIYLHEEWQWTTGSEGKGSSMIKELKNK